jgi:multiple sugar transport system permease protein
MVIYPIGYSLWLSSQSVNMRFGTFDMIGLGNYLKFFSDPEATTALLVSLQFIFESVVLILLLSLGFALVLNEAFRGNAVLKVAVLLPWAVSEYATAIVWKYLLSGQIGLVNTILYLSGAITQNVDFFSNSTALNSVTFAYAWHMAPLGVFFILAGLQTIPEDLYKAGKIDGMGSVRRFWHITFPHIRYSFFIVTVLMTMFSSTATDIFLVMTKGGPGTASETLTFYIYKVTFQYLDLGYGAAASWILIAIALSLTAVYFLLLVSRRT